MPKPAGDYRPHPATTAWSRVSCYAEKLFISLDELEEAGGSCQAAAVGRWSPESHDRAVGQLQACLEAIEGELVRLEMRRRHFRRDRRPG